jgi:hypothetical protein
VSIACVKFLTPTSTLVVRATLGAEGGERWWLEPVGQRA